MKEGEKEGKDKRRREGSERKESDGMSDLATLNLTEIKKTFTFKLFFII